MAVSAVVLGAGVFQLGPHVFARDYDAEINALNQQAQQAQNEADRLGTMAATLEEELGRINAQIDSIRAEIAKSQQKHDALVAEIAKNKLAIEKNRKVMGKILSDIYLDDQISPLEMLASSKSIGDYVDKQEQRSSLRSSLNDKIKEIKALQAKLEENKKSVENVLKDQKAQQSQLASKQAEQAKLVNDTKNDQNAYAALATQRNNQAAKLREVEDPQHRAVCAKLWWCG